MTLPALLLLAGTLTFHLPTMQADAPGGCHEGTKREYDLAEVRVYASAGQSPTWQKYGEACYSDTALWARVRRECAPRLAWSMALNWFDAGRALSLALPSGDYFAVCRDAAGNWSCAQRWVRIP